MALTFWQGDGRWLGYKATTIFLMSGIVKALLDNYWVFTDVPLAEQTNSTSAKFFYIASQVAFTSVLYAGVGLSTDYLRSIFHATQHEDERSFLIH